MLGRVRFAARNQVHAVGLLFSLSKSKPCHGTCRPPWLAPSVNCRGRQRSLTAGRLKTPFAVDTSITRATPSFPWITLVTRASGHFIGGVLSSVIKTRSPTLRFSVIEVHLVRRCWVGRYSFLHLSQKCRDICWMSCHRFESFNLSPMSGTEFSGAPIRKCPGVSAVKSFASSERGCKGLEFNIASIWVRTVVSSSKVSAVVPTIRRRWCFALLIAASQSPPKCGALGGIVSHWKLLFVA